MNVLNRLRAVYQRARRRPLLLSSCCSAEVYWKTRTCMACGNVIEERPLTPDKLLKIAHAENRLLALILSERT